MRRVQTLGWCPECWQHVPSNPDGEKIAVRCMFSCVFQTLDDLGGSVNLGTAEGALGKSVCTRSIPAHTSSSCCCGRYTDGRHDTCPVASRTICSRASMHLTTLEAASENPGQCDEHTFVTLVPTFDRSGALYGRNLFHKTSSQISAALGHEIATISVL